MPLPDVFSPDFDPFAEALASYRPPLFGPRPAWLTHGVAHPHQRRPGARTLGGWRRPSPALLFILAAPT